MAYYDHKPGPPPASFISESIKSRPITTTNRIISQGIWYSEIYFRNNLCTRFIIILFFHVPQCYFYPVVLCISVSCLKSSLEEVGSIIIEQQQKEVILLQQQVILLLRF